MVSNIRTTYIIIIALAIVGAASVLLATRWGIGASPDSIIYLRAARNLSQGQALEMSHHAPLYPAVLAAPAIIGIDPFAVARWLNGFLIGANILLIGLIVANLTKSLWLPILAGLVVLASRPMLTIHGMAWTEPLFIFLGFLGFFLVATYLERSRFWLLVAAAVAIGLAFMTRYAGMALIITAGLGILVLEKKSLARRLSEALLFGVIGAAPMILWLLRNLVVAGTATNRELFFHPFNRGYLWQALNTLSGWLLLPAGTPNLVRVGLGAVILAGLGGILWWRYRKRPLNGPANLGDIPALVKLLLLFLVVYALFLVLSISFLDANILLDDRILSPVFVAGLIVSLYLLGELLRLARIGPTARTGLVAVLLLFVVANLFNGAGLISVGYGQGFGFSSRSWQQSETLAQVRNLPPGVTIFSNSPEAIYLHTGQEALAMPKKFFSANQQVNVNYPAELVSMKGQMERDQGLVVFFNTLPDRRTLPTEAELRENLPLCIVSQNVDGVIYGIDGCPQ